jgi:hypothetical protein
MLQYKLLHRALNHFILLSYLDKLLTKTIFFSIVGFHFFSLKEN